MFRNRISKLLTSLTGRKASVGGRLGALIYIKVELDLDHCEKPRIWQCNRGRVKLISTHRRTKNGPEVFMGLLRIARTPLVTVHLQTTVMDAVRTMHQESIGAVA